MMDYEITINGDKASIKTPYSPAFVRKIKAAGARWNGDGKTWDIDSRDIEMARQIMRDVYGRDDRPADLASAKLTLPTGTWADRGPITFCGRIIASASGRDSGARIGEGVSIVEGKADSGGSVKNWNTEIDGPAIVIIHDVPRAAITPEAAQYVSRDATVEIIDEKVPNKEALRAEKEKLLARIAEINKLLDE